MNQPADRESDHAHLNPRQIEVLSASLREGTDRQVAQRLFISPRTVAIHIDKICDRTGATGRTDLLIWARNHSECCLDGAA
jgi:DNA-binding CsgD family transcriptional regulator